MGREWEMNKIPRTKKEKRLPVVLSPDEVRHIFNVTENIKHKTILMLIYSAGLRVSEAANLKISDIDSATMQIFIRAGKGKKDRYCILSPYILEFLRNYWKLYHPHEWLFPGNPPEKSITSRTIQRIFEISMMKAGITKHATVHTLRHSYATHLLEAKIDIHYIQELMGHSNIKTTSQYIHLQRKDLLNIKSPLDVIMGVSK
jgi:site-specific recombinase XerD